SPAAAARTGQELFDLDRLVMQPSRRRQQFILDDGIAGRLGNAQAIMRLLSERLGDATGHALDSSRHCIWLQLKVGTTRPSRDLPPHAIGPSLALGRKPEDRGWSISQPHHATS